ncbi:uncharacterized protein KZ484_017756 [Pholidichthys leucotaenia]
MSSDMSKCLRSYELTNSSLTLEALDLSQNSFSIFTLTANIFPNLTRCFWKTNSPFHCMRKVLKKKTYLNWPRATEHPELFWKKLRHALTTGET